VLSGSIVQRVPGAAAGAVGLEDFLNLIYAVPAPHRSRGSFVVNSDTERQIRQITDAQGQFLWQPSVQAGVPNRFFGSPIYNQDDIPNVPASGTAADVCIFGDFRSGYQIRDRERTSLHRLNELYAEEGLVGFKVRHRVGGAVVWPEALRVLQVPAA
jgi:HK97 family phage major capsid protein